MRTSFLFALRSLTIRNFILLVASICWVEGKSQQVVKTKNPLQLADQYFAAGEYYTAAGLYEQYLNPSKRINEDVFPLYNKKRKPGTDIRQVPRSAILYKQAESYRLANYFIQADSAYQKCTDNIDALYWRAVCERSLGKFDEAQANLRAYLEATSNDKTFMEAAEKEWQTLQYISKQLSIPDNPPVNIRKLNMPGSYEKGAFAVVPAGGDRYLVSSTKTDSVIVKGSNPYNSHLYYAVMKQDSLIETTPLPLAAAGTLNNQGAASVSANGNRIYFTQWQKVNGRTVSGIYVITKNNESWSAPQLVDRINTNGASSKQPFVTVDGKYLYFASDRPGGSGGFDIWYAPLQEDGSAGEPVNAGTVINTGLDEQAPFYQNSSNILVFSTNGLPGMGAFDLFAAKGSGTTWSAPNNLGYPVNSSRDDIYFFAPEDKTLLADAVIGSDRGSGCCMETYRIAAEISITKRTDTAVVTEPLHDKDVPTEKKFVLRPENVVTVYFDFDKHNLKTEAVRKLDSVYNILLEYPSATLQISGYTDGKGSVEYNKVLSDKRARACADYFIQKGITASRISFESFGACCPLEMELINGRDNPDGRSRNRRALINITKE